MPQVFQVLKCYKCSVFQIHQTKKSHKFECKLCGEKQSIKRHYGIGTGKDCRMHVQKLNVLRGEIAVIANTESNSDEELEDNKIDENMLENVKRSVNPFKKSKWSEFVNVVEETQGAEEPIYLGDREVLLDIPQKRKTTKANLKKIKCESRVYVNSINYNSKVEKESHQKLGIKNCTGNKESGNILLSVQDVMENNECVSKNHLTYNNINNVMTERASKKTEILQIINKNSRWAQFIDTEEKTNIQSDVLLKHALGESTCSEGLSKHDIDKSINSKVLSKYVLGESIHTSSKVSKQGLHEIMKENIQFSRPDNLFSLCDDSDHDKVLDF